MTYSGLQTHLYTVVTIGLGLAAICIAAVTLGAVFGLVLPALFSSDADIVRMFAADDLRATNALSIPYWKCAACGMCIVVDCPPSDIVCGLPGRDAACPMLYVDERGEVHMEPPND